MGRDGNKVIITMEDYKKIRHMFLVEGKSQRQIAQTLGFSRKWGVSRVLCKSIQ